MNVSVAEVLAGAAVRAVPLSAECAGYLVLAAADQVARAPRRVEPGDVLLDEDGAIRVASGRAAEGDAAEGDLRAVLDSLLLRASAPTAGLLRASRRAAGAGVDALVRELETALIPVNRAAARRSLARLERETVRALENGRIGVSEAQACVPAPKRAGAPASAAPERATPVSAPAPVGVLEADLAETPPSPPEVASRLARATRDPSVAPPSLASERVAPPLATKQGAERTERLVVQERTAVLAQVTAKAEREAELAETRPEPLVKRASVRSSAPPSTPVLPPVSPRTSVPESGSAPCSTEVETRGAVRAADPTEPQRTEPLPRPAPHVVEGAAPLVLVPPIVMVDVESRPNVTPFLGTRVSAEPSPCPPDAQGSAEAPSQPEQGVEGALGARVETLGAVETHVAVEETHVAVEETHVAVEETHVAVEETRGSESAESADEVASAVLQVMAPFVDDGDVEIIEVIFDPHEHAVIAHAEQLIDAASGDSTEPCPPMELDSAPLPSVAEAAPSVAEAAPSVAEAAPVFASESSIDEALDAAFDAVLVEDVAAVAEAPTFALCSPTQQADVPCESEDILSIDISVLCEEANAMRAAAEALQLAAAAPHVSADSELPPWATAVPEARDLTPPPRLALPVERPSDVEDLLLRLGEMPLAVEDVRAGLKRLAGMEPTPPPPGIALDP